MTETIKKRFDLNKIIFEIEKFNPHCSREEIIKSLGSHITDIYYSKINDFSSKSKLDRFKRKKLLLQRGRQHRKIQSLTDAKIKQDERITKYKGIKSVLTGFSKAYSYNNAYYDFREIYEFNDFDSSDFIINGESTLLLKDKDYEHDLTLKIEDDIENVDRESKSCNTLIKDGIEPENQTIVYKGLETEEIAPYSELDVPLIDLFDATKFFNFQQYKTLKDEIKRSEDHILSLKENWDGEGSDAFSIDLCRFTTDFLIELFFKFNNLYSLDLEIPTILPVGDLSIDLHWKTHEMELTINFSEEFLYYPSFYGKDNKNNEIQGIIEIDKIHTVIFPWLKNFR